MDVLYILGNGSKWGNSELRYSLRSLERHAQGVDRVVLVGDNPKFLSKEVEFFRLPEAAGNKEYRIAMKIMWACKHAGLSDDFACFNDDHILLKDIDLATYPFYYKCDLREMPLSSKYLNGYQRSLKDTLDALRNDGLETKHFDVHTPIRYNREKFLALAPYWDRSKKSRNGFVVKSVYGNVYEVQPAVRQPDCKIVRVTCEEDVRLRIRGRDVFSFGDHSIARGIGMFLYHTYPDKSKYEN